MSAAPDFDDFPQLEVRERIGESLPPHLRAAYYRELVHCRSLPENDEMLRIIRILQILTFLIHEAPNRIVTERERFEQLLTPALNALEKTGQSNREYQAQLDQRLAQLPQDIAELIQPKAIAEAINESLHQQFVKSTIPETAQLLGIVAKENKRVSAEFSDAASRLENAYNGSAKNAERTIANIERAAARLSTEYRWAVLSTCGLTAAASFVLGMLVYWWVFSAPVRVEQVASPQVQAAPAAIKPPEQPKKRR
jgi:phage host-nuclease inhibitor protein Gam